MFLVFPFLEVDDGMSKVKLQMICEYVWCKEREENKGRGGGEEERRGGGGEEGRRGGGEEGRRGGEEGRGETRRERKEGREKNIHVAIDGGKQMVLHTYIIEFHSKHH